jgi:hypothetical protein
MGKKVHGRLVHEVREALLRAGFMPIRITQLDAPEVPRAVRSPGFKVEKHNDGKSVRLFHIMAGARAGTADQHSRLSFESAQMKRLVAYDATLEQQGFTRIAVVGEGRLTPCSLWQRVDGIGRAEKRQKPLLPT